MSDTDLNLRRRSVLAGSAAALSGALFGGRATGAPGTGSDDLDTADGTIPPVEHFHGTALLNAQGEPLRDESLIAVEAESSARLEDAKAFWQTGEYDKNYEPDGHFTPVPEDAPLPLVAVDDQNTVGTVAGVGSVFVQDGTTWSAGNAQFLLNLWDHATGRAGATEKTVLFHEYDSPNRSTSQTGRDTGDRDQDPPVNHQFWDLDDFEVFREYAERNGYSVVSDYDAVPNPQGYLRSDVRFVLALQRVEPDLVMLSCPEEFGEVPLRVLERYVEDGGAVVLHDSSDAMVEEWYRPNGQEEAKETERDVTLNLNEIADYLGVGFRFNDGVVADPEHNVGPSTGFEEIVRTTGFNEAEFPELFADRPGITPDGVPYHYRVDVGGVKDGDTIYIDRGEQAEDDNSRDGVELRLLGFDSPEDGAQTFERPAEWEGIADGRDEFAIMKRLQFEDACSLLAADGSRLADEGLVALWAEETATNRNNGSNADGFVDYGEDPIPLVSAGDGAVGIGSLLVDDPPEATSDPTSIVNVNNGATTSENPDRHQSVPQFEFLVNIWDDYLGGGATVLYDEGHGQPELDSNYVDFLEGSRDGGARQFTVPDHYTVEGTTDLLADIGDADALWITPPETAFTDAELDALAAFVADGGSVFLHGHDDASADPFTANLNEVAAAVGAPFRFNDDQVIDGTNNGGEARAPVTTAFGDRSEFPFFLVRQGDYNTEAADPYDSDKLPNWGRKATDHAEKLIGSEVILEFDPDAVKNEGLGRFLTYVWEPSEFPDGTSVNEKIVRDGYGRVYDSSFTRHDQYLDTELDARANDRGIWSISDPAGATEVRNTDIDSVFFPYPASVRTTGGPLPDSRAPVAFEPTATQQGDASVRYETPPVVGVDRDARTAMIGAPLVAEAYEIREDDYRAVSFVNDADPINVNTAGFGNFTLLANLIDELSDRESGSVLVEGGHGQFGGSIDEFGGNYTVSAEDARYFERFLMGVGINCEGINDVEEHLNEADIVDVRGIVISTPKRAFTDAELDALREFRAAGGAVVFLGSAEAPDEHRRFLNDVAAGIGSDLRLNDDTVVDEEHNLRALPGIPTTGNFDDGFDLFGETPVESWTPPREPAGGDPPELPDLTAGGSRDDTGSVFTQGQYNRIDITIERFAEPVREVAITDSVPEGWEVQPAADAENSGDVRTVDLGTVTRSELERARENGAPGVTRTYYVEATGDTGRTTFGPATATAQDHRGEFAADSATFGGTDSNTIVGVDQTDPAGSAAGEAGTTGGEAGTTGGEAGTSVPTDDGPSVVDGTAGGVTDTDGGGGETL